MICTTAADGEVIKAVTPDSSNVNLMSFLKAAESAVYKTTVREDFCSDVLLRSVFMEEHPSPNMWALG